MPDKKNSEYVQIDELDNKPVYIVQFPHPYPESLVKNKRNKEIVSIEWNTDGHGRKFVKHKGSYVDKVEGVDKIRNSDLYFWTEWEGPSEATLINKGADKLHAKYLHEVKRPLGYFKDNDELKSSCSSLSKSGLKENFLNTDPCVFGTTFKYSNCRQGSSIKLRQMGKGSLILFGSTIKTKFYLDTVFVVDDRAQKYSLLKGGKEIKCSDCYKELTLNRLDMEYVFYRGITYKNRGDTGMFSFVPAKTSREDSKRCEICFGSINQLLGTRGKRLNAKSTRSATIIESNTHIAKKVWEEVVRQVQEKEFVLGVNFAWPRKSLKKG